MPRTAAADCGTMVAMLALRPDLTAVLQRAREATDHAPVDWLDTQPVGAHSLHRTLGLSGSAEVGHCGRALLDWDLHRGAGLRVAADGPARPGSTVVLALRWGLVWVVAPCRVTDVVDDVDRVGFTYASLAGHPEKGVEQFTFVRDASGLRFEVRAASMAAFWGSRLAPFAARRAQSAITGRYLATAAAIAGRP